MKSKTNLLSVLAGLALFLLLGVSLFTLHSISSLSEDERWVAHTFQVKDELHLLVVAVKNAESFQHDYLLTADESYANRFAEEVKNIAPRFDKLRALTADNSIQQRRLNLLGPMLDAKVQDMANVIALYRAQQQS